MEVIVGTAGHIDHGKTALVKALTGIDADRLPEEKRRGITVDLGFAELGIGDTHFGFVDVPGHERFVKNMLAGASGVDLVLLVIAADEGVMPQTREHFDISRLLGIKAGVIVITKADLVDQETLNLAKLDAAELVEGSFLENSPVVCVSSVTGDGVEDLKRTLDEMSSSLPARGDQTVTLLPIDRSFSVKGFGAVATGTLASGTITEGSEMQLLPSGAKVRIRGLQTHNNSVKSASAGQRVAVNLGGIDHAKVARGMVLTESNILKSTQFIDCEIEVLASAPKPLRSRQRVRVHIGTVEALGRIHVLNETGEIAVGDKDLTQIRLEMPVVAIPGERFIVRRYSPRITIAGGCVIDALAAKHRRKDLEADRRFLTDLLSASDNNTETLRLLLLAAGQSGSSFSDLQARTAFSRSALTEAIDANITKGSIIAAANRFLIIEAFDDLCHSIEIAIAEFHGEEPLAKGLSRESLRERVAPFVPPEVLETALDSLEAAGKIVSDKETIRLTTYKTEFSPAEAILNAKLLTTYKNAGLEPPKLEDALNESVAGTVYTPPEARKYFQLFLDSREIVKVTEEFYFAADALDKLVSRLKQFAAVIDDRLIDVIKFKEIAGVSRKYAIPLLEYFDREHVTLRVGDKRKIL